MPLKITDKIIKSLDEEEFDELMASLLTIEAAKSGCDPKKVIVNAEKKAKDKGQDAYTPEPKTLSPWLGNTETCWQFKCKSAGSPSKLKYEVGKEIPQETLKRGGSYALVSNGIVNGTSGIKSRLKVLQSEAQKIGLPNEKIRVLSCENITKWVNENLALVIELALGKSLCVLTINMWEDLFTDESIFKTVDSIQSHISYLHSNLVYNKKEITHIHLYGFQGVGKTRLALEACKSAEWKVDVLYFSQVQLQEIKNILGVIRDNPESQAILVVDNVLENDLDELNKLIRLAGPRLRLLTIGEGHSIQSHSNIKLLNLTPLKQTEMAEIVHQQYSHLDKDHQAFVIKVSDGFIGWMHKIAEAVARDPKLLTIDQIQVHRHIIENMIDSNDEFIHLLVPAILESVGWSEENANEGKTIAKLLGLNWPEVLLSVHRFDSKFGLAPLNRGFRSISPLPLAIFLAKEGWEAMGDILSELPEKLPSEEAIIRFFRRLSVVAANQQGSAAKCAALQLSKFQTFDDFSKATNVRIWHAVSVINPQFAIVHLHNALKNASHNERTSIEKRTRTELIWALVDFRSCSFTFEKAVLSLAELAEAETDPGIHNNATGEFLISFNPCIGGTEVPYRDRIFLLKKLMTMNTSYRSLAVQALAEVGNRHATRCLPGPSDIRPPRTEWSPSVNEYYESINLSIEFLTEITTENSSETSQDLVKACENCLWMLFDKKTFPCFSKYLTKLFLVFPFESEKIESSITQKIEIEEKKLFKKSDKEHTSIKKVKSLLKKIRNPSDESRFRNLMRITEHIPSEKPSKNVIKMANSILKKPSLLWSNWEWLTDGDEAMGARPLGEALGKLDKKSTLFPSMLKKTDRIKDASILYFYLIGHSKTVGQATIEKLIDEYEIYENVNISVLFDMNFFASNGACACNRMIRILNSLTSIEPILHRLGPAKWIKELSEKHLLNLLHSIMSFPKGIPKALEITSNWMDNNKEPYSSSLINIATDLVCDHALIQSQSLVIPTCWKDTCIRLLSYSAKQIASAIFTVSCQNNTLFWACESQTIIDVLYKCAEKAPKEVWDELSVYLNSKTKGSVSCLNLPVGLANRLPKKAIIKWVLEEPHSRCPLIIPLSMKEKNEHSLYQALKKISLEYFVSDTDEIYYSH
ncbi:hypothetical protein N9Y92_00485 [Chlamydiales bacterium]|nr:hypothetical protein [Chlamydiales bacterium]